MDLRHHIQHCACTCNHMGYGNYMDYQGEMPPQLSYVDYSNYADYQGEVPPCNCMDCANYMEYQMQMEMCRVSSFFSKFEISSRFVIEEM
ncbi:Dipeptidase [Nesidiocoris tenuis]|uniref:Dipeptidase n=1 Tax=Nesidiocoris tenuis TaxID=355587 RepID=A0ABN7BID6_9HEMI|nr:Dipeptidase [Nesidiocoris tenuis]